MTEWSRNWRLVVAAGVGYGTSTFHTATLGAMVRPLHKAFGWTRGEITGGLLFLSLFGVVLFPLVGRVVDAIGSRKVALAGLCLYALTLTGLAFSGPGIASWYLAWAALALFFAPMSTNVWMKPVVASFEKSRGLALGLALTGSGIVSAILPPVVVAVSDRFGWRSVYLLLAGVVAGVVLPLTLAFFRDRREPAPGAAAPAETAGLAPRQAVQTATFWKLAIAFAATGGIATGLQVHLQSMMLDGGLAPLAAATLMSGFGPAVIFGRVSVGFALDRLPARVVAGVAMALPAVAMLAMIGFDGAPWRGVAAAITVGIAYGAEIDLIPYLSSRYFGLKNHSTVYGLFLAALVLGIGLGPGLFGWAFDQLGSYARILWAAIGLSTGATILVATLGPYSQHADRDERSRDVFPAKA